MFDSTKDIDTLLTKTHTGENTHMFNDTNNNDNISSIMDKADKLQRDYDIAHSGENKSNEVSTDNQNDANLNIPHSGVDPQT